VVEGLEVASDALLVLHKKLRRKKTFQIL